jgi:hypothetical protein
MLFAKQNSKYFEALHINVLCVAKGYFHENIVI